MMKAASIVVAILSSFSLTLGLQARAGAAGISPAELHSLVLKAVTGPKGERQKAEARLELLSDSRTYAIASKVFQVSKSEETRASVCRLLGILRGRQGLPTLLAGLSDASPLVRLASIRSLLKVDGAFPAVRLLPLLDDPNRAVMIAALRALSEARCKRAAPKLLSVLTKAVSGGDNEVASLAALALGSSGSGTAIAPLTRLLASDDPSTRLASALALTRLGSRAGGVELLSWLKDREHPGRRLDAVKGLHYVPGGWAVRQLTRALEDDDVRIELAAAKELASRKVDAGTDVLLRLLDHEEPWVRQAADEALYEAGISQEDRNKRLALLRGTAPGRPKPFYTQSEAQIDAFVRTLYNREPNLAVRLVRVSERFLHTPYKRDPLGEGPSGVEDKDPVMRFDTVDCLTFVEETLALALSPDLYTARLRLQRIRYVKGIVSYKTRNHFPMSQWIPNNTKLGLLMDTTRKIAGTRTMTVVKELDGKVWKAPAGWRWAKKLGADALPNGRYSLDIIRPKHLVALESKVRTGTLLFVVRKERPGLPYLVSHVGLIISKAGRLFVRHAAEQFYHRVVDSPLSDYLKRIERYQKWPVAGINLQGVRDPWRKR